MMLIPALWALLGLCRVQSILPSLNSPDDVQLKTSSSKPSELQLVQSDALYDDVEVFSPEENSRRELRRRRNRRRGGLSGLFGGIANGIRTVIQKADWGDIVDVASPFLGSFAGPIAGLGKIAQPILRYAVASPSERKKNGIWYFAASAGEALKFAGSLTGGGIFNPLKILGSGIGVLSSNIMANGGRIPGGKEFAPFAFKVLRDFIIDINPFKDLIQAGLGVIETMNEVRKTGRLGLADLIAPALFIAEAGKVVFPHPVLFAVTGALKLTRDLGILKNDRLPTFRLPAFGNRYQRKFGRRPRMSDVMVKAQGILDRSYSRLRIPNTMSSRQALRQAERVRHNYNRRFNTQVRQAVRQGRRRSFSRITRRTLAFSNRVRRTTRRSRYGGANQQGRRSFTRTVSRLQPRQPRRSGRMEDHVSDEPCRNPNLENDEDVEEDFYSLEWSTIMEVFNNNLPGSADYEAVASDINDFMDRACARGRAKDASPDYEPPEADTTPLDSAFEDMPYEEVVVEGAVSTEEAREIELEADPAIWLSSRDDDWYQNPRQSTGDPEFYPGMPNSPREWSEDDNTYDPALYNVFSPNLPQEADPVQETPTQMAPSPMGWARSSPPAPVQQPTRDSSRSAQTHRGAAPTHSDDLPLGRERESSGRVSYDPTIYQSMSISEKRLALNERYDIEFDQLFGFDIDHPDEHGQRRRRLMQKFSSRVTKFTEPEKLDEPEPEPPLLP